MLSAATQSDRQSPARRRLTRDDLLALGAAGRPWAFLPLAVQAIEQAPDDHALRLMAASSFGALGLRTPALELLQSLPQEAEVRRLAATLTGMADDRLQPGRLTRSVRAGCEALLGRGVDLRDRVAAWRMRKEDEKWLLAGDGNIVRRAASGRWLSLSDDRADAEAITLPQLDADGRPSPDRCEGPFIFDGVAGPWLLLRVWGTTPVTMCGYQPRITVVEPSIDAVFDAMAMADIREVAADPRVEWFVGENAVERFEQAQAPRLASIVAGPVYAADREEAGAVAPIVERLAMRQREESAALQARLEERAASRGVSWWRERYERALAGDEPLRVLIPTTVHSTFLRHSAHDLAAALAGVGCAAEVLTENEPNSRMAGIAYLRAADRLDPDLVITLNTTRRQMKGVVPSNVPVLCWIQDRMARLFDPDEGAAQGPLDFIMGHMFGELFARCGYPRERAWSQPVPVSASKFSNAPAPADLRDRLACEVAYVSHQSEPPEMMLERFCAACRDRPLMERFLRELFPLLVEAIESPGDRPYWLRWEDAGLKLVRRDPRYRAVQRPALWAEFCAPLAERILRMQTLDWAADICHRRGWRLRLFGKGWERHPTLDAFAAGPLEHGDAVRASYQAARVHLHASTHTGSHQRVFECALAGGLMLRRVALGDFGVAEQEIAREFVERAGASIEQGVRIGREQSRLLEQYNARRVALGFEPKETIEIGRDLMQATLQRPPAPIEQALDLDLPGAESTAFTAAGSLEAALERAIGDDAWRTRESARLREWVGRRFTYEALAADIPRRILAGLSGRQCWEAAIA